MNNSIYITHELIMETSKCYRSKKIKDYKQDFERIDSIELSALKKFVIVKGIVHLYGYKIAGDGPYSGFYDVINQQLYTKDKIKNVKIIEHYSECICEAPVRPRKLRKRIVK